MIITGVKGCKRSMLVYVIWNSAMTVCWGTLSCVAVEANPRFVLSAATLMYESRCTLWVWLVVLVTGYSSGPS